jgi:hypothetical protein
MFLLSHFPKTPVAIAVIIMPSYQLNNVSKKPLSEHAANLAGSVPFIKGNCTVFWHLDALNSPLSFTHAHTISCGWVAW